MKILIVTMLLPLFSFIVLAISQGRWSENTSTRIGISSIGISVLVTIYIIFNFYYYTDNYANLVVIQELGSWLKIDNFHVLIKFRLDKLSLVMLSIITGVGFIIHIYAVWYMSGKEGYARFFAYTNLFIANMILLVLSDNLLLIYFGWEGVGLCSYLLIGFYYFDFKNGLKAIKSFVVTRFGDICLICALFMIYNQYNTLSLHELLKLNSQDLLNNMSCWISIFLLLGSIGKSAQLPFQTWLISAMAGPTPVSALIHAATMVTAGVYLISRMHNFFLITPYVLYAVGVIGAVTIIAFSLSALFQSNIKKILAYSTISQIGYMFLAVGSRNWDGALFHLITHAFFKALLFLSAGSLIKICKNEQNIFKMRVLYKSVPVIYICFLVGGASLSGFPIITSGFYSKELILSNVLINGDYFLLFSGIIGVFLTSVYTFRMIFIIFHNRGLIVTRIEYGFFQYFPLIMLLLLSSVIGSYIRLFVMHDSTHFYNDYYQICLTVISSVLVFFGIWLASIFWLHSTSQINRTLMFYRSTDTITRYLILLCHYGWGIDKIYKICFINPYFLIAKKLSYYNDPIRLFMNFFILLLNWLHCSLVYIEHGKLNWGVISINIGFFIVLFFMFMNL